LSSFLVLFQSDIGHFGAQALLNPDKFAGRTIELAGDELTMEQARQIYAKVHSGGGGIGGYLPVMKAWIPGIALLALPYDLRTMFYVSVPALFLFKLYYSTNLFSMDSGSTTKDTKFRSQLSNLNILHFSLSRIGFAKEIKSKAQRRLNKDSNEQYWFPFRCK